MYTTIKILNTTLNRLYKHKQRTQTYDNLINHLIDLLEQIENTHIGAKL